jgi:phage terminase large subunit-like protein
MWRIWAHKAQLPPVGDWRIWLLMGGRGAGKTRAGAEWVRRLVDRKTARRIALVAPTLHDAREVMVEGPSGLKAIASAWNPVRYHPSRRRLEWRNGAIGYVFSAEDPDSLRGPQFDAAWCDEIGAWPRDEKTWDMLMFGLRLGERPRVAATTTPRPRPLVQRLDGLWKLGRSGVAVTRVSTRDNAANLAPGFVDAMEESYLGTETGRQELEGELIADPTGALWKRETIERLRVECGSVDGFERVVVAVDPPAGVGGAACGIVAVGLKAGVIYVLGDHSARGLRPLEWAQRAVAAARTHAAGVIVAEANQGGEMVRQVLEQAGAKGCARVKLAHARGSKWDRALPISGEYDAGRVRHVGVMRELEDEMCCFGADGGGASPDRVDALVWAASELMKRPVRPGVIDLWAE